MSRGAGAVQRWLLAKLPPTPDDAYTIREMRQAVDLASDYYLAAEPSEGQASSIRRALRGLEQRQLVIRHTTQISRHGDPSFWTLARVAGPEVPLADLGSSSAYLERYTDVAAYSETG